MDRNVLAKNVLVADHDPTDVLGSAGVLWGSTDHAVFAEFIVRSRLHSRFHHSSRGYGAVVAEFDVGLHAGKRPDAHAGAQTGLGTHVGQRMNAHGVFHA
jgi:hypothetical protein